MSDLRQDHLTKVMTTEGARQRRERFFDMLHEARSAACDEEYITDFLLPLVSPLHTWGGGR